MKILAIGAHMDDIELGCGGTIAKAIANGHQVKILIMSPSGYTNIYGNIQRTDIEANREQQTAFQILGVTNYQICNFPSKEVYCSPEVINQIDLCITNFQPDLIFTHYPFDTHQSHVGTAEATMAAARRHNNIIFYEPLNPTRKSLIPFNPNLYIDISDYIDVKLNALRAHASEITKFGGETWLQSQKSIYMLRGYEIGTTAAEAFQINRLTLNFNEVTQL